MRYAITAGSHPSHSSHCCCFQASVVDTSRPYMIGGRQYYGHFESVCECMEVAEAELVCAALNAADLFAEYKAAVEKVLKRQKGLSTTVSLCAFVDALSELSAAHEKAKTIPAVTPPVEPKNP